MTDDGARVVVSGVPDISDVSDASHAAAEGPAFAEAWHAEVYALAASLIDRGLVSQREWTEALAAAIAAAQAAGDPDLGDTYYEHWLLALESLCASKGLALGPAVDQRAADWRQAYLHTPHGQPVELRADLG